jgi:hypothetical protein
VPVPEAYVELYRSCTGLSLIFFALDQPPVSAPIQPDFDPPHCRGGRGSKPGAHRGLRSQGNRVRRHGAGGCSDGWVIECTQWRGRSGNQTGGFRPYCRLALPNNADFLSIYGQNHKTVGLVVLRKTL